MPTALDEGIRFRPFWPQIKNVVGGVSYVA